MASASQRDSGQLPGVISFRGVMVLGPMVRVSTLPLRLLALEQGADLVWTEEMVAKKVAPCARIVNLRLNTIEFYDRRAPWTRVWQTCAAEKTRVVFQLGASTPEDAVAAAKVVEKDVAAFCLNMGCPKEFSVKSGMGAALLNTPQQAASIIRALKHACPAQPVVAKIRMLNSTENTVALMRCLEDAGASALTVHCRHVTQRSSEPAHRAELRKLVAAVTIPVLGNGDIIDFAEAQKWRLESGCAGVMVARQAAENPSCFRAEGRLAQSEMILLHLEKCVEYEDVYQNIKYYYNHFFSRVCVPGSDLFVGIADAKSRREIAAIFDRNEYYDAFETSRGCGSSVEEAGWWKGDKTHTEYKDYLAYLALSASVAGANDRIGVGEKREREPQRDVGDRGSGGRDAKVFQCKACAGTFVSRNALFKHMRSAAH